MLIFKIKKKEIPWWAYVFFSTLCPNVLIGQIALLLFVITSFFPKIDKSISYWIKFLVLEFLFILFSFIQCFGIAASSYDALQMTRTIFVCFIFDVSFILFSSKYDIDRILKIYVNSVFCGMIMSLLIYGNSIGNTAIYDGRFTSAIDLQLGPIHIFGHSPTALAAIASNALIIAMIIYWNENRKKALFYFIFFTVIILLTQSRKNLVFAGVSLFFIPLFYSGKGINMRKIKIVICTIIIGIITLFCLIKIPFLYQHIGERLLAAINSFIYIGFDESNFGESSIRTRAGLVSLAIDAIHKRPIWGWGLNNFSAVINNGGYYAHNNYLEILVSGGVVGLIIYYSKYLFIGFKMFKGTKLENAKVSRIYKMCFLMFLVYCLLEYWQITYMFRFIYVLPIMLLQYSRRKEKSLYEK